MFRIPALMCGFFLLTFSPVVQAQLDPAKQEVESSYTILLEKDGVHAAVTRADVDQGKTKNVPATRDAAISEKVSRIAGAQLAGPNDQERASGFKSILAGPCKLDNVVSTDGDVTVYVTLSKHLAAAFDDEQHELLQRLAIKWSEQDSGTKSLRVLGRISGEQDYRALSSFLPESAPVPSKAGEDEAGPGKMPPSSDLIEVQPMARMAGQPPTPGQPRPAGALSGASIFISPGHGWFYNSTLGRWATQRGNTYNIIEDMSNGEAVLQNLVQYLWNAGARVYTARERDLQTNMVVIDNTDAGFAVTGNWATGSSSGVWKGANYQYAAVSATETATARWTPNIPAEGFYAVYAWYPGASNRSVDARYTIYHTGGSTVWTQNQQRDGSTWLYMGTYHFAAGSNPGTGSVLLSNQGSDATKYVMADAMRFGGGMGDYADGGSISGKPRWEESGKYYSGFLGYTYANGTVNAMPRWAAWERESWETYPCYISIHSNAFDGTARGTETYAYSSAGWGGAFNGIAGGDTLRNKIHDEVINDLRIAWDSTWVDRGKRTADLGEINPSNNSEMPAALIEMAFHDHATDARQLADPNFRLIVSRAMYQGVVKWYNSHYAFANTTLLPEPPTALRVVNNGAGAVTLAWNAPPYNSGNNLLGNAATGYRVYRSANGKGFDNGVSNTANSITVSGLTAGQTYYFKVSATNAGGESFPTETLAVRVKASGTPRCLIVNGFDAIDRFMNIVEDDPYSASDLQRGYLWRMNSYNYAIAHAKAIAAANVDFDSCANEAVIGGSIDLSDYHTVVWILGEESVGDKTFDATEQSKVTAFLNGGGRLFVSGAEIGWEMVNQGAGAAFYQNVLRANYVADDANTYSASGQAGSIFSGISLTFDNGASIYNVGYPDVIGANAGSAACMNYVGGTGGVAGIQYAGGSPEQRIVMLGFPFETITSEANRNAVMAAALNFFGTALPNPPAAPSGLTATAASQTEINLTWTDNSANETNFVVARSTTSGGPYTDIATLAANTTSYSNTGLTANTAYYYVVRATNTGGASANSAQASATTLPNAPAAPGALAATAASQTQINLTWTDNSTNETNFVVARSTTSGGPYTDIATLAANTTSYSNAGLTAGTAYYYVVRATNTGGASANSAQASATTLPNAPTAPSALAATAASQTQINLNWTDNSANETNFVVARATTSGGPYTDIATLAANTTGYSNTGLTANTAYYYVVRATNAGGASANSAQASATTLPNAPAAPSALAATAASQTQINLNWTDNSANETNFVVARSTTSGGPYTDIATLAANTTGYSNTGLTAGTAYYYVVRATNTGGASANSAQANATTLPNAPAAPSALAATAASQTQINLAWTDNSANETNFVVARATTSGGPYTDIATLAANTTGYSNTGLTANTAYYYVVRATNTGGASANSPQASATTLPNAPAAPSALAATAASQTQINLNWTDNSANETNFVVARATTSGGPYTDIATLAANTTGYSNTGLTASTTYYYVVRATNVGGASANSAQASATTLPNAPTAPSALAATAASQTQINLTWADNSANETNFVVARSTTSGGPYTNIATLAANTTGYSNTGLTAGTAYYYVVRATNAGGASANSAQASATTLPNAPAAPSGLAATAASQTQINLTWVDNSANETNFVVARSTTSGGPYTNIATLAANTTSYSNTGLTARTTYYYVVRATNAGGASANSAQASATTSLPDVIVDNTAATFNGSWTLGTSAADKYGSDYRFATAGTGATATYNANVPAAGNYQIQVWYSQGTNRSNNAPHTVNFSGGNLTYAVNQQANGGKWVVLGTHYLAAGGGQLVVNTTGANPSVVIADAVRFTYLNAAAPVTLTCDSVAAEDGYILESGENTSVGGTVNSANTTFAVGDYTDRRQYLGVLSFDTSAIPDGATIQKVTLKLTQYSINTADPWAVLGACTVDIKAPNFGAASTLATDDFAAAAGASGVATVPKPSGNGVQVSAPLDSTGVFQTSKTGKTQLRVRFTIDDDNDSANDYVNFYSGNYNTNTARRPKLEVQYTQ